MDHTVTDYCTITLQQGPHCNRPLQPNKQTVGLSPSWDGCYSDRDMGKLTWTLGTLTSETTIEKLIEIRKVIST